MAKKKPIKTLYFINGPMPNEEQQAEIDEISGVAAVRNVRVLRDDAPIEDFDFVAGEVPEQYALAAAEKEAARADAPEAPKASPDAPAAPKTAEKGAAKPTGNAASAWKPNG